MKTGKRRPSRGRPEIEASARTGGIRGPNMDGNYSVCCPYCITVVGYADVQFKLTLKLSGTTRTTEVELSPEHGTFNCYRCETHGLGDFRWVEQLAALVDPTAEPPPAPDLGPPESFEKIPILIDNSTPLAPYARYLLSRGVMLSSIAAGVGACTRGKYAGRVVVPHRDSTGRWLGFSARAIDRRVEPRYLYPAGMDRRKLLWGVEHLVAGTDPVWLVEGVFDAMPLFPCSVAGYGKNITDEQLELLVALGRPIVVCLDGDAWKLARSISARLQLRRVESTWCHLPPGTDPGQLGWAVARHIVPK